MKKNISKKRVLILGADGFIGSNLVKSLQRDAKYKIFAFDFFKDGFVRNIETFDENLVMVQGNFLNRDDIKKSLKGIDFVFHFVSLTTPGSSMDDPLMEIDTNLRATLVLLEECVKAGVKKIIFPSSGGGIYGNQNKKLFSEDDPTNPISPYAISKLAIEKFLEYFKLHHDLDYLVLRYSNPYGPGQNVVGSQGIIPIFLNLVKQGKEVTIFGDGKNIRDYIFIDDAIENTKKISFKQNLKYRVYNIGKGKGATISEVVVAIQKATGRNVKIKRMPARGIDVRRVMLDLGRAKSEIKYSSKVSLEEGIEKTWKWVQGLT
jgi:UDP-glucose 4-epimerase